MNWIEKHSINCINCNNFVDERDCCNAKDEGELCLECQKKYPELMEEE